MADDRLSSFQLALQQMEKIIERIEKNIEKLFDFTRKCSAHDEAIDTLKLDYHFIKNKVVKNIEETLEKNKDKIYIDINKISDKIDNMKKSIIKTILYIVFGLIGTTVLIKLIQLIIEKAFPKFWEVLIKFFS